MTGPPGKTLVILLSHWPAEPLPALFRKLGTGRLPESCCVQKGPVIAVLQGSGGSCQPYCQCLLTTTELMTSHSNAQAKILNIFKSMSASRTSWSTGNIVLQFCLQSLTQVPASNWWDLFASWVLPLKKST